MIGTLVNAGAIVVGGTAGAVLGDRFPATVRQTVTDVLGLFVVVLGVADGLTAFGPELQAVAGRGGVLVVLGALVLGGVVGEVVDLEGRLTVVGERLRDVVHRPSRRAASASGSGAASASGSGAASASEGRPEPDAAPGLPAVRPSADPRHRFVEGFVLASLVVCVGPLAILGPLQDGLHGDLQLLAVKAVLDGVVVLALASALGLGPVLSALPLLVLQGSVTLVATWLAPVLTPAMIDALTATGGFLVIGIGLRLLEVRAVRVANLLPALLLAPVAVALWPG